jgi:cytosine/adenosine deaminase-related metal-dependent hydrolase
MADSAQLARQYGVSMHTHLAEDTDDVAYSLAKFGRTPARYAEELGWLGPDVWHAHCVKLDRDGIRLFAAGGTGVAHCPCSNMRLGSGIAPIGRMRKAGVPVGLGVDGSASNDSGNLIAEMRQAMLLQRVKHGAGAMSARQALEIATVGGARVLGRTDIGHIAPGMAADLAIFDLMRVEFAGALHDPVAALAFCGPVPALHTVVNGCFVVRDGRLTTVELGKLVGRHNQLAAQLVDG